MENTVITAGWQSQMSPNAAATVTDTKEEEEKSNRTQQNATEPHKNLLTLRRPPVGRNLQQGTLTSTAKP